MSLRPTVPDEPEENNPDIGLGGAYCTPDDEPIAGFSKADEVDAMPVPFDGYLTQMSPSSQDAQG
eukprot:11942323-Karenia_brevis.AAC.1